MAACWLWPAAPAIGALRCWRQKGHCGPEGTFGSVLALAGSARYRGAALLAAEGALRAGAGLVTLASVEPVLAAASARLPECCLLPCIDGAEGGISPESLSLLRRQKTAVLLAGPGLGYTAQSTARAAETRTLIQQLLSSFAGCAVLDADGLNAGFAGCAVLDADGLNAAAGLLSAGQPLPHPAGALVLTPHPGEMARLTGLSTGAVNADREGIARRFAQQWDAVVLLKGMRTIIAAPDGRCFVNPTGNPGLARGGSGDALAGILAALLACGLEAAEAAACAAWLHGAAADRAAAQRGLARGGSGDALAGILAALLACGLEAAEAAACAAWLHGAAADRAAAQRGEYGMLPQDLFPALGTLFAENGR